MARIIFKPEKYKKPPSSKSESRLAQLRIAAGLTQAQLAELIHVRPATIRKWEHGEEIKNKYLDTLKNAIGYTPEAAQDERTVDTRIAGMIRARRESLGMSMDELAGLIGCLPIQISQYERGISIPYPSTLEKIAVALSCAPEDIGAAPLVHVSPRVEAIRRMRTDAGLTYRELSRRCGIAENYLSDLMRKGICEPTDRTIALIARACGCSPENYGLNIPDDVDIGPRTLKEYPYARFGRELRRIREQARMDRGDVARKIGIDHSWYYAFESGKELPPFQKVEAISEVLCVPASQLHALREREKPYRIPGEHPYRQFGEFLRALREREGLSRKELCAAAGIGYSVYSLYELGTNLLLEKHIDALAAALHEPADHIRAMRKNAIQADSIRKIAETERKTP